LTFGLGILILQGVFRRKSLAGVNIMALHTSVAVQHVAMPRSAMGPKHMPKHEINPLWSICLVLSHMFGYLEQKLQGRSRKSLFFRTSNFFGSEKFQVSAHVLPIKKVLKYKITFSCTFAVIQFLDNIGSLPFISWAISMTPSVYYFVMPIYGGCAKFQWPFKKFRKNVFYP
jgi:hypothetical protein